MPLASTFMDEETMDGCIRKAVEWCEGLPSHNATHVKEISMSETIGVARKGDVWCWASDLKVVAQFCGWNKQRMCVLQKLVKDKKIHEARAFNFTYRYIDDVLSINNSRFAEFLPLIYPPELEVKETTCSFVRIIFGLIPRI